MAESYPQGKFRELALGEIIADSNIRRGPLEITQKDSNLVQSIREHGVLEPIIVTTVPGETKLRLVAGYRRFEAVKQIAVEDKRAWENAKINTIVYSVDEYKALEMALIENLQRVEMDAVDRAAAIVAILDKTNIEQKALAEKLGVSQGYISQHVALDAMPKTIKQEVKNGAFGITTARLLSPLLEKPEQFEEVVVKMKEKKITAYDDVNDLVQAVQAKAQDTEAKAAKEKAKTEKGPRKAKAKADAPKTVKESILELIPELKVKVPSEKTLRNLLSEYAEKYVNSKSEDKRAEYRLVWYGIRLASGADEKLPAMPD